MQGKLLEAPAYFCCIWNDDPIGYAFAIIKNLKFVKETGTFGCQILQRKQSFSSVNLPEGRFIDGPSTKKSQWHYYILSPDHIKHQKLHGPQKKKYHVVMTNSLPWKITMLLIGKPSISMGHFPWLCQITRG
jgi:hypothetical protein